MAQIITGIDSGGAETHLLNLTTGLIDRGYNVDVIYLKGDGELDGKFRKIGCNTKRIGLSQDVDPTALVKLITYLANRNYDIVHTHLIHADLYGAIAASVARIPVLISTKHNDPPFWNKPIYRYLHNKSLDRSNRIIAISNHVKSYLLRTSNLEPDDVETVHYGIRLEPFDVVSDEEIAKIKTEFNVGNNPTIGTVARLSEQKNISTLLKSFNQVIEDFPRAKLIIVGRGELETELRELANDLNIASNVAFAGFRKDIPSIMKIFDIFVLPSLWEGFGRVFLEAMAASIPIIASNRSAIPEIIVDGETGVLVDPENTKAIAEEIIRFLCNKDEAKRIGNAGRIRVEEKFNIKSMVNKTIDIYEKELSNTGEYVK